MRARVGLVCWVLFALTTGLAWGCKTKKVDVEPRPSVTIARELLYPYLFEPQRSLRALDMLQDFLHNRGSSREAEMARWLVGRSYLDMLTRSLTARAQGLLPEAEGLEALLVTRLGLSLEGRPPPSGTAAVLSDAAQDELRMLSARAISEILGETEQFTSLREEVLAARRLLAVLEAEQAGSWDTLTELAESGREVSYNARLLIASAALRALNLVQVTDALEHPRMLARHYPFPCPQGLLAFAQGDRSLSLCSFLCAQAVAASVPLDDKQNLLRTCTAAHFGFTRAEDVVYLSPENFVLVRTLSHMSRNLRHLETDYERSPAYSMHVDFVQAFRRALEGSCMPAQLPLMGPSGSGLELPRVCVEAAARPDHASSLFIGPAGVFVALPARFRVDRGELFIPETALGYRFPGRQVSELDDALALPDDEVERGRLARLRPSLDDLVRDRASLERLPQRSEKKPLWTTLMVDGRVRFSVLRKALRGSVAHGEHLFEWVVWSDRMQRLGAVRFDAHAGPPSLETALLRVESEGFSLQRPRPRRTQRTPSRADTAASEPLLQLYQELVAMLQPGETLSVWVHDEVDAQRLVTVLELARIATHPSRPSGQGQSLEQLLSSAAASALDEPVRVVLSLSVR